ncbi:hypothetical protein HDU67_003550 [Dinochytrium kinnereticum]|nr:hypothetical protein HDU67_003550 [Dinochytrium kinnereticum]
MSSARFLRTLTVAGGSAGIGGILAVNFMPRRYGDQIEDHHMPADAIRSKVESTSLVRSLLKKPDLEIVPFRPVLTALGGDPIAERKDGAMLGTMKVDGTVEEDPVAYRSHLLRGTSLYGPGKIEYAFGLFSRKDKALIKVTKIGENLCGHPGIVHGGLISALFDDYMGALFLMNASGKYSGFTANLSVDYRVPMPAPSTIAIVVWIERVEGRKVFLKAEAHACEPSEIPFILNAKAKETSPQVERWIGSKSIKFADASSLYIIPRDQYDRMLKSTETV